MSLTFIKALLKSHLNFTGEEASRVRQESHGDLLHAHPEFDPPQAPKEERREHGLGRTKKRVRPFMTSTLGEGTEKITSRGG